MSELIGADTYQESDRRSRSTWHQQALINTQEVEEETARVATSLREPQKIISLRLSLGTPEHEDEHKFLPLQITVKLCIFTRLPSLPFGPRC
jgi:hypothetical protein